LIITELMGDALRICSLSRKRWNFRTMTV